MEKRVRFSAIVLLIYILAVSPSSAQTEAKEKSGENAFKVAAFKSKYRTPNSHSSMAGFTFYFKARDLIELGKYNEAIELLQKGVELGDINCRMTLAKLYRTGEGVEQNQKLALEIYHSLDRDNFPAGTYMSGLCYENGWGAEKDYLEAAHYYERAINLYPYSSLSYRALGSMYFGGRGVEKNYKKAFELYQKAAKLKNAMAAFNVGLMLEKGFGVEKDEGMSLEWYEKASELGEPKAMHYLAQRYEAKHEYLKAIQFYSKAVQAGYPESGLYLGLLLKSGRTGSVDMPGALKVLKEVAGKGHLEAAVQVGLMFVHGDGVPQSFKQAGAWYQAAADKGYDKAMYLLGKLYLEGKGIAVDEKKGMELIRKASELGYLEATEFLES